jgi:hypothetical protein
MSTDPLRFPGGGKGIGLTENVVVAVAVSPLKLVAVTVI